MKKFVPLIAILIIVITAMPCLSKQENPPGKQRKSSGGIWVYDANDNRIGMQIGSNPLLVYIPELDAVTQIEPDIPGGPYTDENWYGNIYEASRHNFNDEDQTTPYLSWSAIRPRGGSHKMLIKDTCGSEDQYYISNNEMVSIYVKDFLDQSSCTIKAEGTSGFYNNYELIPIEITDIPFPVPLVGPFRYQFVP